MLGVVYFILKWMMKLHDKVMADSKEERVAWQTLILSLSEKINEHTAQAKGFHDIVNEAHKFQKEEHERMIDLLTSATHSLERICK